MAAFLFATFLFCLSGVVGAVAAYALGFLFPGDPRGRFVVGALPISVFLAVSLITPLTEVLVIPVFGFFAAGFVLRSFWELMVRQRDRAVAYENAAREVRAHTPYRPGDNVDISA